MYSSDDEEEIGPQMIGDSKPITAPILVDVIEKEEEVLSYTQKKRQQIVKAMMGENGELLNSLEKGDKMVVLAALDGMDRAALGKKRIKTDEKTSASQAAAAILIAKVLQAPGAMQAGMIEGLRQVVPVLPADLPEPVTVPGEMESDSAQMNFDTFMAQTGESPGLP